MFETVKTIIDAGGFNLADLTHRINVLFARGELTEEESAQLLTMAQEEAKAEDQLPPLPERVSELELRTSALEERVSEMESAVGDSEPREDSDADGTDTGPDYDPEWPPYVRPTSKDTYYNKGDKITFTDGKHYICIKNNIVDGPDINPNVWKLIEDTATENAAVIRGGD